MMLLKENVSFFLFSSRLMLIRIFVSLTFGFYFSAVSASPFSVLECFSVTERKAIGVRRLERVKTAKKSYPKRNGVIKVRN